MVGLFYRQPARIDRRILAAGLLSLALAAPAAAQGVVHDGEANQSQITSSSTTHTVANKTTAGTNRLGVLRCAISEPTLATGATWNSVAMTPLVTAQNPTDLRGVVSYWIAAPATAASSVVLTTSAPLTSICVASSYTGAHQTTQAGDTTTASGTTSPASVDCTVNANELIVDILYFLGAGTVPAVGADQTSELGTDNGTWHATASRQAAASGQTMSWTLTSPTRWTQACAALQPAAAAPSAVPSILLLGVGGQ